MPVSKALESPTLATVTLDENLSKGRTLRGIDVFAPGDLSVVDLEDNTYVVTFPTAANGGSYPRRWIVQIRMVTTANTTIAASDLIGLV